MGSLPPSPPHSCNHHNFDDFLDEPDLSMNGVFFVCVLSCPRRESVASIVHFAALLIISSQSRQYQSALLNDVFWSHVGGQRCRVISRSSGQSFVMFSRMRTSNAPNSASSSKWTWRSQLSSSNWWMLPLSLPLRYAGETVRITCFVVIFHGTNGIFRSAFLAAPVLHDFPVPLLSPLRSHFSFCST